MAKNKNTSNIQEIQNAAKTLFANIQFADVDNPVKTIVVTSSVPNEGKTTMSLQLAQAIASSGKRTLLVEADMRRRSLAGLLGLHSRSGAYAVMSSKVPLSQAVMATNMPTLFFLDCEPKIPNPADLISSHAYKKLIKETAQAYDYVVFDTPPVGTFVDAAVLSRNVDGTIMVVKMGGAKRTEIEEALGQLRKADANILGMCATFCEGTGSEYYYEYYNKDNKRVEEPSTPTPVLQTPSAGKATAPARHAHGSVSDDSEPSDSFSFGRR